MAGRGPQPKDPRDRARGARGDHLTLINTEPAPQPALPALMPNGDAWPQKTRDWWQMWSEDDITSDYRATDWSDLMDAAVLHGLYWSGNASFAGELRLRIAKHGATQEDRARLRKQYAEADSAETRRDRDKAKGAGNKPAYGGLKVA